MVFLVTILATTLAGVAHGRDWLSKGIIIALHCVVVTAALYATVGLSWYLIAAPIAVLIWWFTLRTSRQAIAELEWMDKTSVADSDELWQSYLCTSLSTGLVISSLAIAGTNLWYLLYVPVIVLFFFLCYNFRKRFRIGNGISRPRNRMIQEAIGGAYGGLLIGATLDTGAMVWMAYLMNTGA